MVYSQTGIVNLALGKIGAASIVNINEDSNQAIRARNAWEYIRDEVLEAGEWRFGKLRVALAQSTTTPLYTWDYAYPLPADYLKLCLGTEKDPSVYPTGYPWVIEVLSSGRLVLLTNYDNSSADLFINYIMRVVDVTKYSASFVNTFAFRLGAEFAISLTEGMKKHETLMTIYGVMLRRALGVNQSGDSLENETGSTDWEFAGR